MTQTIGKYELLDVIGRGGFAVVYKARDTRLNRQVALKALHPHWASDPNFAARRRASTTPTSSWCTTPP